MISKTGFAGEPACASSCANANHREADALRAYERAPHVGCAVLARYVDLRRTSYRVSITYLGLHSVSLNLTTPLLRENGLVPTLGFGVS